MVDQGFSADGCVYQADRVVGGRVWVPCRISRCLSRRAGCKKTGKIGGAGSILAVNCCAKSVSFRLRPRFLCSGRAFCGPGGFFAGREHFWIPKRGRANPDAGCGFKPGVAGGTEATPGFCPRRSSNAEGLRPSRHLPPHFDATPSALGYACYHFPG